MANTELMSLDEEFGTSAEKVDLSSVQPPEELQKQISQLYSLALRNNRFNLIRMFAGFNSRRSLCVSVCVRHHHRVCRRQREQHVHGVRQPRRSA